MINTIMVSITDKTDIRYDYDEKTGKFFIHLWGGVNSVSLSIPKEIAGDLATSIEQMLMDSDIGQKPENLGKISG